MILEIKTFPDEVLRKKAEKIDEITPEIHTLATNMTDTMYAAPGYGIAAPQVGISKRLIAIDDTLGRDPDRLVILINPEIVIKTGELYEEEGCLSIPGEYAFIKRFKELTIKFLGLDGKEHILETDNTLSRVIQHEIDHLDGHLFIDILADLKRDLIKKNIRKRIKSGDYIVTTTL